MSPEISFSKDCFCPPQHRRYPSVQTNNSLFEYLLSWRWAEYYFQWICDTSEGISITNSPNHGFASFGFTWSRWIIFWCIFRSPFATMPAEGRSLCTFSNRNCWQNLSCKLSGALSCSLKKPFTLLIPLPVDTFSKQLLFVRIRAGRSWLVNSTLAAILDFFVTARPSWILPSKLCNALMHHLGGGLAPPWLCPSTAV